jgi:CRP-like cAMP-binding protein
MDATPSMMSQFVDKLLTRTRLTDAEQQALLELGGTRERFEARKNFVLLGQDTLSTCFVLEGICARVEQPMLGRRQITAFYIRGDMPDLYSAFNSRATAAIETLTPAVIVRIPHAATHKLMRAYPAITEAFARYLVADAAISNEWVANVGGRDARASVAHLYCEMAVRNGHGGGNEFSFHFPITQTILGEATGLSTVHANRTCMALRKAKIMLIDNSVVHVLDWNALQEAASFDDDYLITKGQVRLAA